MRSFQIVAGVLLALLPSRLKNVVYRRVFGYRIGRDVRIGFSPLIGVVQCRIGDHVRIGSFNLFHRVEDLAIGEHARIGFLNLFRGGQKIRIGAYTTIIRQNVFNSIIDPDFSHPVDSVLELGQGVSIASGHWFDFSARIEIGSHSIVAGRNSSLWTHSRQRGKPILVGCHCFLGSEVRVAPGVEIPSFCIVALGSVVRGQFEQSRSLIGGNPASATRALRAHELQFLLHRTRPDLPDHLVQADLPPDLLAMVSSQGSNPKELQSPSWIAHYDSQKTRLPGP